MECTSTPTSPEEALTKVSTDVERAAAIPQQD
jgi:hypothetical protein